MRVPGWLQGCLFGNVVWGVSVLFAFAIENWEAYFPRWANRLDLPDTLGSLFSVIAAPIALGGWLVVWGDSAPPFPWLNDLTFNICFAVCFYALVGGLIGFAFSKTWPMQFTAWKLLVFVAVAIVSLGCLPLLWEQMN
jgi:hypothetical protein